MNNRIKTVLLLLISFWLSSGAIYAQNTNFDYGVKAIPDSLKKSANAVVRYDEMVFYISGIGKAMFHEKYAITILKKSGQHLAYFARPYNKFVKISNVKGTVYDASGKIVFKIRPDDIHDISLTNNGSLYVDNRAKIIRPEYYKYPFTVEYSYELNYKGLLNYPDWNIMPAYNTAVQHSSFELKKPAGIEVRILNKNCDFQPVKKTEKNREVLKWEVNGLKAMKKEPFGKPLQELAPSVLFAPNDFIINGYKGNCETWEQFGKWIYTLTVGRDNLPEKTEQKIRELISGADTEHEKAEILYKYLQDKMRYVNISVGIGGWQPIDAAAVDEVSYGDCKALSNYMKALLEVAGIQSYYTLVKAGENAPDIIRDFPSNQFNHVILCALIDSDTVWLECTDQRIPFGYIGSFTDDRDALLISEEGGKLTRTKRYTAEDNSKLCTAAVVLDGTGDGRATIATKYKGYFYDQNRDKLLSDDQDRQKLIRKRLHLPDFNLESYNLEEERSVIPAVNEELELIIHGCGTIMGNEMLVNLNIFDKIRQIPTETQSRRKSDIVFRRSLTERDSVTFMIPPGLKIEKIASPRNISSEFGEFKTNIYFSDSLVTYVRKVKIYKGVYPPERYNRFVDFYKEIKKADSDRMIIVEK